MAPRKVVSRPAAPGIVTGNGNHFFDTRSRGLAVLNSPQMNKGTAFTAEERKALYLTGLVPPDISSLEIQSLCHPQARPRQAPRI